MRPKEEKMKGPLSIDLPYPSLVGIEKDIKSAVIIAPAYASMHGELNAILQYLYHYFNFKGLFDGETADVIMGICVSEMHHLKILGELLYKLGTDPIYTKMPPYGYNYYTSVGVSYSKTPIKMLLDDVSSEILAVKQYEKMADDLKNERVAAIIKRIMLDEELHIKILKERLIAIGGDNVRDF